MNEELNFDICVIGAGSGGLSFAYGASQMGARVALIEGGKMGGDCLNYGCVPSKSLLSAAKMAHNVYFAKEFGINVERIDIDFAKVKKHVENVIQKIAPKDSIERYEKLGVKVYKGIASFIDENKIKVNDLTIKAKYFVIATGSKPVHIPIPGLDKVDYLTNETIFSLESKPKHLVIIGGGPIGSEMAQAFKLLGSEVSIIEKGQILAKDDPELTDVIRQRFLQDKIKLYEKVDIVSVSQKGKSVEVKIKDNDRESIISGSHLLLAVGRTPNILALNLAKAKVEFNKFGVVVNSRLRSSNKRIYALGDVAGSYQFTHVANYHAGIALRNILFHLPAKVDYSALPWVTYTFPELAHVGLQEEDAQKKYKNVKITKFPFSENDRAIAEKNTNGLIKVITKKNGQILGVSIVGAKAGELISFWTLAIKKKMSLKDITSIIAPYPTLAEINKQVAGKFYMPVIFSNKVKRVVRFLLKVLG